MKVTFVVDTGKRARLPKTRSFRQFQRLLRKIKAETPWLVPVLKEMFYEDHEYQARSGRVALAMARLFASAYWRDGRWLSSLVPSVEFDGVRIDIIQPIPPKVRW